MALSEPDFTPLGERLRERTQYLQEDDAQYNYAHSHLCEGMMRAMAQTAELVDPPDPYPPWAPLFNVDICPAWALPWLAQVVGVRLPGGMSEVDQRNYIKGLSYLKRGTPDAILAAVRTQLTGTQTVWLRERDDGNAYRIEIIVRTVELRTTLQAVIDAVKLQKPAGIVMSVRASDTWDYQEMTSDYIGKKYKDLPTTYPKYSDLTGGPLA
jgi:P2-related tail formation protein